MDLSDDLNIYVLRSQEYDYVHFSHMVSGWAGVWAAGKSLSGLYLRNCKV